MRKQLFSLAIISLVSLAGSQTASAREGGARFNYAPNTWSLEGPVVRRAAEPQHSVRSGSVPRGSSFLGVDPQMLAKAPAPLPQTTVNAQPVSNQTAAQVLPKNTPFNNAFGKPVTAAPPVIAQAMPPVAPLAAAAKALPPVIANKPVTSRKPGNYSGRRSSRDVHGVLNSHKQKSPEGLAAVAGHGLDSYGKNVGYVPGPYLPQGTGDGVRTEANVSGRIIR